MAGDLVRRVTDAAEEVREHAAVAFNGPPRAGTAVLLGKEGVEAPAPAGSSVVKGSDGGHGRTPSQGLDHTSIEFRLKSRRKGNRRPTGLRFACPFIGLHFSPRS